MVRDVVVTTISCACADEAEKMMQALMRKTTAFMAYISDDCGWSECRPAGVSSRAVGVNGTIDMGVVPVVRSSERSSVISSTALELIQYLAEDFGLCRNWYK